MKVEKMKESRRRLSWLPKAALVALLGAAVVFAGCSSDDDDGDDNNTEQGGGNTGGGSGTSDPTTGGGSGTGTGGTDSGNTGGGSAGGNTEEEDVYLYPLYSESFDYVSIDNSSANISATKSDGTTVDLAYSRDGYDLVTLENGILKLTDAAKGNRSVYLSNGIADVVSSAAGKVKVSFEASMTAATWNGEKTQQQALLTEIPEGYDNSTWQNSNNNPFNRNYLFALNYSTTGNTFTLGDGTSLSDFAASTWYCFDVYITYTENGTATAAATIRERDSNTYVFGNAGSPATLTLPETMDSYDLKAINLMTNKNYGAWAISNVKIACTTAPEHGSDTGSDEEDAPTVPPSSEESDSKTDESDAGQPTQPDGGSTE